MVSANAEIPTSEQIAGGISTMKKIDVIEEDEGLRTRI